MFKKFLRFFVILIYAVLLGLAFIYSRKFSLQDILNYTPKNVFLTVLFFLFLYALKSITVFFPIMALQIAGGFLFGPFPALFLNIIGTMVACALPYYLGRIFGAEAAMRKIEKNEKLSRLLEKQHKHEFFLSFFLRVISCLPSDLVSMYLGALKFKFYPYLISSLLGILPGLIPATFLGEGIRDPLSPLFIVSLLITVLSSLASILIYNIYNKNKS